MSDTSFISHRMFVAALERDRSRREKTRLSAAQAKSDSPPGGSGSVPYRKEVMAAALARQLLGRSVDLANGV